MNLNSDVEPGERLGDEPRQGLSRRFPPMKAHERSRFWRLILTEAFKTRWTARKPVEPWMHLLPSRAAGTACALNAA
jgi:hypothetical protein